MGERVNGIHEVRGSIPLASIAVRGKRGEGCETGLMLLPEQPCLVPFWSAPHPAPANRQGG